MARFTSAFKSPGDTVSMVAPYARTAGQGCLIGSLFGVSANDAANGAAIQLVRQGVFTLDKTSAEAYTAGQLLYWNDTTKLLTSTASTNKIVGVAVAAAANPSSSVDVLLSGPIN